MLEEHNKRDKAHLINLISKRSNDTPNFALLIGAGASASSGIKTTSQMITEWRRQLREQSESNEPLETWLQKQDWYQDEEEYSILFEKVYDQRSQRRIYIEECVKDAKPSWGYIYLANIIAHNYFNVIFTPNFDDLLNEACFLYADLRPIVCAHDSAVVDIRVTSARPKIIKLHGDFLYDSIKTTVRETESLEKNMRDKFMQFAREYGLVVTGYGGNDRSIMDIFDTMMGGSEGYFPHGLYWCLRNKDKVSKKLNRLMRRQNAYWVEIDGFDESIAELHEGLRLTLPNAVRDPYKATTERLNKFISPEEEVKCEIIKNDIGKLEGQVRKFEQIISGEAPGEEFDRLVPYRFLGNRQFNYKHYKRALIYYGKAMIQNPDSLDVMMRMVLCYIFTEQFGKALEISEQMIRQAPNDYVGYLLKGEALCYLNKPKEAIARYSEALQYVAEESKEQDSVLVGRSNTYLLTGDWEEALSDAEKALKIDPKSHPSVLNKSIALKRLGRVEEANQILQDFLSKTELEYSRACAFATLGDKEKMLKELKTAIKKDSAYRVEAKFDPDFADYHQDPDFQNLFIKDKSRKTRHK